MTEAPAQVPPHPRVLVVGGASGMGRWMAQHVFRPAGCAVTAADVNPNTPQLVASLGFEGVVAHYDDGRLASPSPADFDMVLLAVPVPVLPAVVAAVAPLARAGALVCDVASVKGPVLEALLRHTPPTASVLSLHPLFGPTVRSLSGQHIAVIVPPGRAAPAWRRWLEGLLAERGAVLVPTTAEEHDATVAVTQALAHFASLGLASTLQALHRDPRVPFDLTRAWAFKTPVYEALIAIAGRILAGDPALYAAIQVESAAPQVRDRFLQECQRLLEVVRSGDAAAVARQIADIGAGFERSNYERAMRVSQALVAALGQERQQLLASVDRLVALEHTESPGTVHVGVLRRVDLVEGTVELEERTHRGADGRYVVVYDDASAAAAARWGVRPTPRSTRLSLGRFRLLSAAELHQWRMAHLRRHTLDVSVRLPQGADPEALAGVLSRLADDVVDARLKDVYHGEGLRRATLQLEVLGDREPRAVVAELLATLARLGYPA